MRVPLKWLSRYVELDRDAEELAKLLNSAGTEVARIDRVGSGWDQLRVAEILKIEKHPNADRLALATVNTGNETMTVVCGAPNIAAGQKVPFAPVGATIQGTVLEARPIRGIKSEGMLCAADELGLSPDHAGILVLEPSETPGTALDKVLGDDVLELEVTPNRSDCLGIVGVAREVAALTGKPLRLPDIRLEESGAPIEHRFKLRIDAPDLCPRFVARLVADVTIAQSPWWLQSLLHAAGVRAINNVVDVTNFIMLEWGKPIHAYDYDYLRGREIIVRRAADGEKLTTLDGVERTLSSDTVVIADGDGPIGLGGVMGGADSEVKDSTRNVLLESANFDAVTMRRTARRLGMHSEAVRRFAGRMRQEASRLTNLVQDMITLSRIQAAEPVPDPVPVQLDAVVAEALDRCRMKAAAGGIELAASGQHGLAVEGDEDLLVTALRNLLENAVAYSPEKTRVVVSTRRTGDDTAEISVADQGIGIPERDLERIFERFYRVDPARSRATGGTGLGLAIVKHVTAAHGGKVTVWSKEGAGSTFTLRLPLRPSMVPS